MSSKKIKNEKDYKNAVNRIEELLKEVGNDTNPRHPKFIELDELTDIVADYEEKYYTVPKPSLREVVELRMFEMKLTQKSLAELLGTSASRINEYLKGKRDITINMARALYKKLNIDPEIILGQ